MGAADHHTPDELMHQHYFTPEELGELLELSPYFIREEVRRGRLKAVVVDHQVFYIHRDAVLAWLRSLAP